MSYENAPSMPPTPGGYRAPSYPPPTPVSHQPSYEQHGGYSSNHDSAFYNVYTSSAPKKKNTRASQVRIDLVRFARKLLTVDAGLR